MCSRYKLYFRLQTLGEWSIKSAKISTPNTDVKQCFVSLAPFFVTLNSVKASLIHPSTPTLLVSMVKGKRLARKIHRLILMMSWAKTSLIWLHAGPPFPLFGVEEIHSNLEY